MRRLAVVVLGLLAVVVPPAAANGTPACLPDERIDQIRTAPAHIADAFARCTRFLKRALRREDIAPTDARRQALFAALVAHRFAPEGEASGYGFTHLRRQSALDSDTRIALAFHVFRRAGGARRVARFRGWDGGTLGNHAQLWLGDLLVDPTFGFAAQLPLRRALRGKGSRRVVEFPARELERYKAAVRVVRRGGYPQQQVLYRHRTFASFAGDDVTLEDDRCLHPARIERMRERPRFIPRAFELCRAMLASRLKGVGIAASHDRLRAAFAAFVAHRFAPYGHEIGFGFNHLRRSPDMDCDNYVALAFHIYERSGGRPKALQFRGWDGGTLGNHAQLWVGSLMVDPTWGFVAHLPVRDALDGVPSHKVLGMPFFPHYSYGKSISVVENGEYPLSEVLYVHRSFESYAGNDPTLEGDPPR